MCTKPRRVTYAFESSFPTTRLDFANGKDDTLEFDYFECKVSNNAYSACIYRGERASSPSVTRVNYFNKKNYLQFAVIVLLFLLIKDRIHRYF